MPEPQVTPELFTTPIRRFKGQRSRYRYPHQRLEPGYCKDIRNVDFSELGTADRRGGYVPFNPTPESGTRSWVGLRQQQFITNGRQTLLVTPVKVYTDDGTTQQDITGTDLTASTSDQATFAYIADRLFFTNTVDTVRYWDGDASTPNDVVVLAGAGVPFTTCVQLMPHRGLLLALAPTEGGAKKTTRVRWCKVNAADLTLDTDEWPSTNRTEIYDGGTAIIGGVENFGTDAENANSLALIFKEDGLYPGFIDFRVGKTEYINLKPRRGFHPIAPASFLARPGFVWGIAREGAFIVLPDLSVQIVTQDNTPDWEALNKSRLQYAVSGVRETEHQIRTLLSSVNNEAGHDVLMVYDWETGDITFEEYTDKMNTIGTRLNSAEQETDWLGGLSTGLTYIGNSGSEDNGVSYDWELTTVPDDLDSPGRTKTIHNLTLWYRATGSSPTVSIEAIRDEGVRKTRSKNLTLGSSLLYDSGLHYDSGLVWPGGENRKARFRVNRTCENLSLRISGDGDVALHGYSVEGELHE